jgi:glycine cleavage system H protein
LREGRDVIEKNIREESATRLKGGLGSKVMYPEEYRYSKEHEWIKVDGDRGTIGITDYAQQQLGDVVFVELPEVGATFSGQEVFGNIESVKAVSELFCPISGEVLEINQTAVDSPELVNKDPHGEAWLIVIKIQDQAEVDGLLSAADYKKYLEEEAEG